MSGVADDSGETAVETVRPAAATEGGAATDGTGDAVTDETETGLLPTPADGPARALALACALALTGSYLAALYGVTAVVGGTTWMAAGVAVALVSATALARHLPVRAGLAVGGALFVGGFAGYLLLIPDVYYMLFTVDRVVDDVLAMVAGRSVVLFLRADVWATSVAPGPAFLGWYLALRRRYAAAASVGMAALGFFVLTGDASGTVTRAGVAAALGLLALGSIERSAGTWRQVADAGLVVAFAVVLARFVSVVPDGSNSFQLAGGPGGPNLEGELVDAGEELTVQGSVSLAATTRFTVVADRAAFWHAGSYDRYTGGGWARAGGTSRYTGPQAGPPSGGELVRQRVHVEAPVATMPAAWKPVLLDPAVRRRTEVSALGGLRPAEAFEAGDQYTVLSQVPEWSTGVLRNAGTDYPADVEERFLQLPSTLPERFAESAAAITEAAETPYDKAQAVQSWLAANKTYSLSVRRPDWDVADAFVHEMNRGYCTYFATAMVALLRAVDVPARFAVGYLPGEQVGEDRWVVRGYDSHAWVEVYFPDVGWVPFDPTPSAPREAARRQQAPASGQDDGENEEAGGAGSPTATTTTPTAADAADADADATTGGNGTGADLADGSRPEPLSDLGGQGAAGVKPTPTSDQRRGDFTAITAEAGDSADPAGPTLDDGGGPVPARDRLSALVALGGMLVGAYRLGLLERAGRELWLRWLPATEEPHDDVKRAYDRLEYYLSTRYREREPGETPREYLDDLAASGADARIRRVGEIHQRSRYAGRVTRSAADEARRLVEDVVRGRKNG